MPTPNDWTNLWPDALAAWSPWIQLRPPVYFATDQEAAREGMAGQIAAIRLRDQSVMVNQETVKRLGLEEFGLAILAHEIGHHVYVPGNLTDNARMLAAMKATLFNIPNELVHMVANLYGDLLLNDRLQRGGNADIVGVYRRLRENSAGGDSTQTWLVYTRAYEYLWRLPEGTLTPGELTREMDADAALIARLIRHYAGRWLAGARRFASILYPYLIEDEKKNAKQTFFCLGLGDCRGAGIGAIPDGLTAIDASEFEEGDDFDRELAGMGDEDEEGKGERKGKTPRNTVPEEGKQKQSHGQHREPFQYGELLKALGLDLSQHEITTRYYRERALPHLIPYPQRKAPRSTEPLPEGYDPWDAGEDLQDLDLFGSLLKSPEVVPGVTTVQRVYGETPGGDPAKTPVDLDIYVDCSGSMPEPSHNISYLALAGTILALSALRIGARVQATLWSGPRQFDTTGGFTRDEKRILGVITGYLSGSTAFPLHILRDTYEDRPADQPPAHIVVISDDGADTMLAKDEERNDGMKICRMAMKNARGGGTLLLNLWNVDAWHAREPLTAMGFKIHAVTDWEQLVAFARAFVREVYAGE
jgi:hypothetical protein